MKSPFSESIYRAKDPNPRGGFRGARGVTIYGDHLIIANAERLLIFDSSWKFVGEITHPWMGGVHDILVDGDGIWVTCATADLLLKVDWTGKVLADWEWRLDKNLTASFGFRNLSQVDRRLDYRDPETMRDGVHNTVHLNAVSRSPEGLLLSFGRILSPAAYKKAKVASVLGRIAKYIGLKRRNHNSKQEAMPGTPVPKIEGSSSALILLREDGSAKILKRIFGTSVPNHNVIQVENSLIYNDSNGNRVVATALDESSPDRCVEIPGQPGFVRGLAQLDKDSFLVGSQAPAANY